MKRILTIIMLSGSMLALPGLASAKVNVFACEPEWGALAKAIGGDNVAVKAATTAQQDPHHVRAKPSLLAAMRRADLVICSGAGLEIGWLPILLEKAGNGNVQSGADGSLMAADFVHRLEVPAVVDRAQGDVHPQGNPHIQTDPRNIAKIAPVLGVRLARIDPAHAAQYKANTAAFMARWYAAIARWTAEGASLKGIPLVSHHKAWAYLENWLELKSVGTLEPKPGIPPTASHLEELLGTVRAHPIKVIIRAPYEPAEASQWLSEKTGVPAAVLPFTVGGDAKSGDLFALFDRTISLLKEAANHAPAQQ